MTLHFPGIRGVRGAESLVVAEAFGKNITGHLTDVFRAMVTQPPVKIKRQRLPRASTPKPQRLTSTAVDSTASEMTPSTHFSHPSVASHPATPHHNDGFGDCLVDDAYMDQLVSFFEADEG